MAYLCRGPDCVAWQPEDKIQIKLKDQRHSGNTDFYLDLDYLLNICFLIKVKSKYIFSKKKDSIINRHKLLITNINFKL